MIHINHTITKKALITAIMKLMTWWASTQHVMQYIQQNNITTIHQNTQLFNHFPFTSLDSFQVARLHGDIYHDKHIGKYIYFFVCKAC